MSVARQIIWFAALIFGCRSYAAAKQANMPPPVKVALTFDDLPAHGPLPSGETRMTIVRSILATLKVHHVREAYGFVAGSFGGDDPSAPDVLKVWRAAGQPLGNHSWSHFNLDQTDPMAYIADVGRNEAVIAPLMARKDWHWFRYPYLAEGADPQRHKQIRAFLARSGYKVASVTLSFADYDYNEPYARCMAKNDKASVGRLEAIWMRAATSALDGAHRPSNSARGQNVPLVTLLHVGAFTAHMLPALLTAYEARGVRFIDLATAERDSFYANDLHDVGKGQHLLLLQNRNSDTSEPLSDITLKAICP